MSTYLLLRDNKQSGPYSTEELVAKGLKAYDLVWLEGKSAAWRYPSEMPELKAFAPTVEEQPYDRFYKKPAAENSTTETSVANTVAVVAAVKEPPRNGKASVAVSKNIYVTLPSNSNNTTATRRQAVMVLAEPALQKAATNQTATTNTNTGSIKAIPAVQAAVMTESITSTANVHPEEKQAQFAYSPSRKSKALMPAIIGACLLLGGIVIGLAISNNLNKTDKTNLEKMVQAIAERNNAGNKPVAVPVKPEAVTPVESMAITTGNISAENKTGIIDKPVTPVVSKKKEYIETDVTTRTSDDLQTASPQNVQKEEQAVTTHEDHENVAKNTGQPLDENAAIVIRQQLQRQVSVSSGSYKTGVLGGISGLQLTVTNSSHYLLDEVVVEIKYLGPEKRVVKTQTVLFNDIPAGEQKALEVPRSNRGVSIDYNIVNIHSRILGLASN
ncbi:MAG: hypothetical protein QM731_06125 [Chitinophagaceae bacterium]